MTPTAATHSPLTRVLLVDDHPLYRAGLAAAVNATPGFVVVAEAGGRAEALQRAASAGPDLALVDLRVGTDSGIGIAAALKGAQAELRVLICSAYVTETDVREAARNGLNGYVLKTADLGQIRLALRETMAQGTYWASEAAEMLVVAARHAPVTPRERDVLERVAQGASDKEIAEALGLSRHTVVEHLSRVREKLGARNRAEVVVIAQQRGIIPPAHA
jgi:DNA-binding NarL/FixJ family response regulator